MIDCARCRSLIDDDLQASLDPPARAAMANHLRTCQACVGYKTDRLRDASVIGRSVAELDERDRAAPPPPPAARPPRAWPWVVLALAAVGVIAIGAHLLVAPEPADEPDAPPRVVARPDRPPTPPADTTTTEAPAVDPPPERAPAATEPTVAGVVYRADGTTPAPGISVALYAPAVGRIVASTQTDATGSFSFPGRAPMRAVVCAHTDAEVAGPLAATTSPVRLRLRPGRRVEGRIAVDGLAASDCRLLVRWPGGGAVPTTPGPDGTFHAAAPAGAAVEVLASPSVGRFVLRPHPRITLATSRPAALRGARAATVRVELRGLPDTADPLRVALVDGRGDEVTRLARDLDGTWFAAAERGAYRVAIVATGYDAVEPSVSVDPDVGTAPIEIDLVPSDRTLTLRAANAPAGLAAHIMRHPPLGRPAPTIVRRFDGADAIQLDGVPWRSVRVRLVDRLGVDAGTFVTPGDYRLAFANDAGIDGRVVAPDGAGLAGVLVRLQTGPDRRLTYTNANGGYAFDDVPVGPAVVCPASLADAIEQGRLPSAAFEVVTSAGARVTKPLELLDARLSKVGVRDEAGRATAGTLSVRTENGELAQRVQASVDPAGGLSVAVVPAVLPGSYRVDWTENGVVYPLGRLLLPGAGECVVRRSGGALRIVPTWASPFPASGRAWLSVDDDGGQLLHRMPLGSLDPIALGGLGPGRYHVTIRVGSTSGHAIADVPDGAAIVPIAIR